MQVPANKPKRQNAQPALMPREADARHSTGEADARAIKDSQCSRDEARIRSAASCCVAVALT